MPIHHNDPDRPLIQLTDRHRSSRDDLSPGGAAGCGPLNIMKVCEMHAGVWLPMLRLKSDRHFACVKSTCKANGVEPH